MSFDNRRAYLGETLCVGTVVSANYYHQVTFSSQFNSSLLSFSRFLTKSVYDVQFLDIRENGIDDLVDELNELGVALCGLRNDAQPARQFQFGYLLSIQSGNSIIACPAEQALNFRMGGFTEDNDAQASLSQFPGCFLGTADYGAGGIDYPKLSGLNL